MSKRLTLSDLAAATERLGCSLAQILAVTEVEAGGGWFVDLRAGLLESEGGGSGFLPDGRVKILFEPHVLWRVTNGALGEEEPLSSRRWGTWRYGSLSEQHRRLEAAAQRVGREAAIQACSWGLFQILGEGWHELRYASPADLQAHMIAGEGWQLDGFVRFVAARRLLAALQAGGPEPDSWRAFALRYNGSAYASHDYHGRLAAAWSRNAARLSDQRAEGALYQMLLRRGYEIRPTFEGSPAP